MSLFKPLCYILQHILSIFIKILINYDSTYVESCLLLLEAVLKGKKGFGVCEKWFWRKLQAYNIFDLYFSC